MNNATVLFGSPGCGKTTKLLSIFTDILKTTPPERVAYVSFTRKGTYEGVARAMQLYNLDDERLPFCRTLHSIAFRSGKLSRYGMISKSDYKAFSDAMGMHMTGYYTEEFYNNDDKYLFYYFLRRNNPKAAERFLDGLNQRVVKDVEHNFEKYKQHAGVKDFTDIIEDFVRAGQPLPVDYAIIDEAQDLTTLQWQMCEVAFADCKKVYVAGDDDQAIYEWSGADVDYFLDLPRTEQIVLDQSWRLKTEVLDVAKRVSGQIKRREQKVFAPVGSGGCVKFYNTLDEINVTPDESWYFLARNNCFLSEMSQALQRKALVFTCKDKPSFDRREIEAVRLFETARKRGKLSDTEQVRLKLHVDGEPDLTQPWYNNMNFPNDTMAYYRDLFKFKTNLDDEERVQVNTIHGVKGGEADNVVVRLDFTKSVRANMERNPDSELRCLYVALTRAKKNLHVVCSNGSNGYDNFINLEGV